MKGNILQSSFRDPAGFLFERDGILYRQVNKSFADDFDFFLSSGLYKKLVDEKLLISHTEVHLKKYAQNAQAHKVIRPQRIPFISYPYEWSFSQLKDAARVTLGIQKIALEGGMSLRDASAYNIQFMDGRPVHIDTLSFEKYREGTPWVAYRQFCQHFLAPLALMSYREARMGQLSRVFIDGVPLDLASRLLPTRSKFNFALLSHIHLHARNQRRNEYGRAKSSASHLSKSGLLAIVDNLNSAISELTLSSTKSQWAHYYDDTNYSKASLAYKKKLVRSYLAKLKPKMVWDLGANVGVFSRIAAERSNYVVAFDLDPMAVEANYHGMVQDGKRNILPLVIDFSNPSASMGWDHRERMSFVERGPADLVMALALIHHLRIVNNVPLHRIAQFFAEIGKNVIVEWVPKDDSQVQRLLSTREDIFTDYTQEGFEKSFGRVFKIKSKDRIRASKRIMYLVQRKK